MLTPLRTGFTVTVTSSFSPPAETVMTEVPAPTALSVMPDTSTASGFADVTVTCVFSVVYESGVRETSTVLSAPPNSHSAVSASLFVMLTPLRTGFTVTVTSSFSSPAETVMTEVPAPTALSVMPDTVTAAVLPDVTVICVFSTVNESGSIETSTVLSASPSSHSAVSASLLAMLSDVGFVSVGFPHAAIHKDRQTISRTANIHFCLVLIITPPHIIIKTCILASVFRFFYKVLRNSVSVFAAARCPSTVG